MTRFWQQYVVLARNSIFLLVRSSSRWMDGHAAQENNCQFEPKDTGRHSLPTIIGHHPGPAAVARRSRAAGMGPTSNIAHAVLLIPPFVLARAAPPTSWQACLCDVQIMGCLGCYDSLSSKNPGGSIHVRSYIFFEMTLFCINIQAAAAAA